jgi:recombination protein RecT
MSQIATRSPSQFETWLSSPATIAQFRTALPSHFAPDRMARLALTQFRTVPNLRDCDAASIMGCVMQAAQLGLEPGVLGSCYLIPRKNQCTLLIGYQGLLDLIRRSGQVRSIACRVVYEADEFSVDYGAERVFVHRPNLRRTDERILGFYCHAVLSSGEEQFEWMPLSEVDRIRRRSQSGNGGPWTTDFAEMGKKTVLRRAAKYLPRSIELSTALVENDRAEFGDSAPETVAHVEVVKAAPSPSSSARLPAPPPPPSDEFVQAIEDAPPAPASPEVVPFEDDGFPL